MTWAELVFTTCAAFSTPELPVQISTVAEKYDIDKELVLAIVWKESRCDASALGSSNDSGLMQVVPRWHGDRIERLGITDLFDPAQNLLLGVDLLVSLGAKTDPRKALATYNGGPARPAVSYRYADHVLDIYSNMKHGNIDEQD